MAQIEIENLTFSYPLSDNKAIDNLSLSITAGEFILLCGKSGCGKTTLLRQIKKELSPHGKPGGKILINGKSVEELTLRESAESIGYVMQNPDSQIVTDKVWHELAFGLENLGLTKDEIRLRIAEAASYFGISQWFNKKTSELSGGQKQIMNLASVMIMRPDILLLDEPMSQLDPISAEKFLLTVNKLNKELGTTVILAEQRLEDVTAYADRIIIMENGNISFDGTPENAGKEYNNLPSFFQRAAPSAMRIFNKKNGTGKCPVTVREGREWLSLTKHIDYPENQKSFPIKNYAVEMKDICFRYEKNGRDILRNLSLKIPSGCLFALLGANGSGKTTLMKIISSCLLPYSGKIKILGKNHKKSDMKIAVLPQNVQALFTGKTVLLDLKEISSNEDEIKKISQLVKISNLLQRHPYDLSGGEQQRAALAKVLLCSPEIILLDEPTKGMDSEFKNDFAAILKSLIEEGKTVIIISHDVEFCAEYADYCAMLFDGEISAVSSSRDFFQKNRFFTTAAGRMAHGIIKNAVTEDDICECIK